MRKAQIWSMDVIIAITLFTLIFIGLFLTIGIVSKGSKSAELVNENELISEALLADTKNISIISENKLNKEAVLNFSQRDYEEIKSELGITSDFCIFFEEADGDITDIDGVYTIGDPSVNITFGTNKWMCDGTEVKPVGG